MLSAGSRVLQRTGRPGDGAKHPQCSYPTTISSPCLTAITAEMTGAYQFGQCSARDRRDAMSCMVNFVEFVVWSALGVQYTL
jgi:hypothetical protein